MPSYELVYIISPEVEESKAVTGAVERMTERLKMDSIVQDYSKKLKMLEESEKRILRFMKLQGLDKAKDPELEKKLGEEGVDVADWHKLLALSGSDDDDASAAAVAQLASMLARLDEDVGKMAKEGDPQAQEKLAGELKQVNSEVSTMAARTQNKIEGLVEAVTADMEAIDRIEKEAARGGQALKMSRKQMLVILGEVVQELCQPLSVISCSVDMLKAQTLGDVTPMQAEMLQLVSESATKIKTLIDNLERIAGPPTTLVPDKEIQMALNQ